MEKLKHKKGEVELNRFWSLVVLCVWGIIMLIGFYFIASHMGWIGYQETTTISCANGDIEVWNGSGMYCGIYVETIEQLEKEITGQDFNLNNEDYEINLN